MNTDTRKEFDLFTDEYLQERTTRTTVLVGSSKIDDTIFRILSSYFLPKTTKKTENDELLEGDRPLSTFSSRIKLIYRLGLIDKSFFMILERIRAIRNESAHKLSFDITKNPLKGKLASIVNDMSKRESYSLIKQRYFNNDIFDKSMEIKCMYLTICMLLEAIRSRITSVIQNEETCKISMK